ncbi:hypothetical protein BJ741DRAFT_209495 [Chytriomyces cf. hyalinus JEL632]|nr:hypothetical protein BJ741DRAFT_209495 [Chytriomyces cf. hyalinus JEL632]
MLSGLVAAQEHFLHSDKKQCRAILLSSLSRPQSPSQPHSDVQDEPNDTDKRARTAAVVLLLRTSDSQTDAAKMWDEVVRLCGGVLAGLPMRVATAGMLMFITFNAKVKAQSVFEEWISSQADAFMLSLGPSHPEYNDYVNLIQVYVEYLVPDGAIAMEFVQLNSVLDDEDKKKILDSIQRREEEASREAERIRAIEKKAQETEAKIQNKLDDTVQHSKSHQSKSNHKERSRQLVKPHSTPVEGTPGASNTATTSNFNSNQNPGSSSASAPSAGPIASQTEQSSEKPSPKRAIPPIKLLLKFMKTNKKVAASIAAFLACVIAYFLAGRPSGKRMSDSLVRFSRTMQSVSSF